MRPTVEWRSLLSENRVPFIEKGANVKRGEINIRCPFCGNADPSFHMGLNLDTGWFSCWRNKAAHSGKSPLRLLMALLHIPYWKAREIAGLSEAFIDPEGFTAVAARLLGRSTGLEGVAPKVQTRLTFPEELESIDGRSRWRRHRGYLEHRGFSFVDELVKAYDLRASLDMAWRDRVILPYSIDKELVTWTGRAIGPAAIRYKDLSIDDSLVPPKETLFNYDCIAQGGRALILVEGPLDALKIDFYGFEVEVRAVAFSTNSMTEEQSFMIEEAVSQFDRILVMMDNASPLSVVDGLKMKQQLGFIPGIQTVRVPFELKDAGEMSPGQAFEWTDRISNGGV